jgi:hypothetical protein
MLMEYVLVVFRFFRFFVLAKFDSFLKFGLASPSTNPALSRIQRREARASRSSTDGTESPMTTESIQEEAEED